MSLILILLHLSICEKKIIWEPSSKPWVSPLLAVVVIHYLNLKWTNVIKLERPWLDGVWTASILARHLGIKKVLGINVETVTFFSSKSQLCCWWWWMSLSVEISPQKNNEDLFSLLFINNHFIYWAKQDPVRRVISVGRLLIGALIERNFLKCCPMK